MYVLCSRLSMQVFHSHTRTTLGISKQRFRTLGFDLAIKGSSLAGAPRVWSIPDSCDCGLIRFLNQEDCCKEGHWTDWLLQNPNKWVASKSITGTSRQQSFSALQNTRIEKGGFSTYCVERQKQERRHMWPKGKSRTHVDLRHRPIVSVVVTLAHGPLHCCLVPGNICVSQPPRVHHQHRHCMICNTSGLALL